MEEARVRESSEDTAGGSEALIKASEAPSDRRISYLSRKSSMFVENMLHSEEAKTPVPRCAFIRSCTPAGELI